MQRHQGVDLQRYYERIISRLQNRAFGFCDERSPSSICPPNVLPVPGVTDVSQWQQVCRSNAQLLEVGVAASSADDATQDIGEQQPSMTPHCMVRMRCMCANHGLACADKTLDGQEHTFWSSTRSTPDGEEWLLYRLKWPSIVRFAAIAAFRAPFQLG
jgi:hypothetical protein